MKLAVPFIQLPLAFDHIRLAEEIHALGEACWRAHPQKFAGNSMLPLLSVNGDPGNESFSGQMLPTPELQRCAYLKQTLSTLGATLGRTRLMRLSGHAEVTRHADQGYYWTERVRVHIPVVTQPTVRFECGDSVINMAAGECWIFDTWRQHRVINDADDQRIHLVVDTVGGRKFWQQVAAGRCVPEVRPGNPDWRPAFVAPDPQAKAELMLESMNIPTIMSPWELERHLAFLVAESPVGGQLDQVKEIFAGFLHSWRALWACHGDAPSARPLYRRELDAFIEKVRAPANTILLANDIRLFSGLMTIVCKFAAGPEEPRAGVRS